MKWSIEECGCTRKGCEMMAFGWLVECRCILLVLFDILAFEEQFTDALLDMIEDL